MFIFPGFNSNIEHRNKTYHIQTEVNTVDGVNKINTLIYFAGRIFLSFSVEMKKEDTVNREVAKTAISRQHNRIIRDLISDQLEEKVEKIIEEEISFENLYEKKDMFFCSGKCYGDAQDTYKKLMLMEEN
jgi:hypothetical protein